VAARSVSIACAVIIGTWEGQAIAKLQALLSLLASSKVPTEYIEGKQKAQEDSDEEELDDEAAAVLAKKEGKKGMCLKMLSTIVDPMRAVLSAAKTLYPRKLANGDCDLVRSCSLGLRACSAMDVRRFRAPQCDPSFKACS
jgi:hypothetical protein